jgi:hypothetical protein
MGGGAKYDILTRREASVKIKEGSLISQSVVVLYGFEFEQTVVIGVGGDGFNKINNNDDDRHGEMRRQCTLIKEKSCITVVATQLSKKKEETPSPCRGIS